MKNKKRLISLPRLKDKAWDLISLHVRQKGARGDYNQCYTCYQWKEWKYEMDCGHYLHGKLDYDLDNLKPQCQRCNHFLRGNLGSYAEHLIRDYGQDFIDRLRVKAQLKGNLYSRQELNEIIEKYGFISNTRNH